MKALPVEKDGVLVGWRAFCPACREDHLFDGRWSFNGDQAAPTFRPSMRVLVNDPASEHYQPRARSSVCHSFVTDGRIQYLSDCTHALAGQTVDLPDFESLGGQ